MRSIIIDKSLHEDITAFCELNQITDFDGFINETLKKGFDMKKYGDTFALFFNKSEEDIVHLKPKLANEDLVEENKVVKTPAEPEIIVKKRGRKKKEEPKVEEVMQEIEQPKEPAYKIKEEEIKKPEKKYVSLRNKKDDNYDVYDEL